MKQKNIVVFGGTEEGRIISQKLSSIFIYVTLNVISEYGENLIEKNKYINVIVNKMNEIQMERFLKINNYNIVIDATHPYADEVTKNIKTVCEKLNLKYIRYLRSNLNSEYGKLFNNTEEIINYLNNYDGNVFLTTGTNDLEKYINLNNYKNRLFVRTLPCQNSIDLCRKIEIPYKNIICMHGPFSVLLNKAMFIETNTKFAVTKESGKEGGFNSKIEAAKMLNIDILILKRPEYENKFNCINDIDYLINYVKMMVEE